jgi:hypothetical protein
LNDIWRLAREKWQAAGRPGGDSSRFWLEAEQELLQAADRWPMGAVPGDDRMKAVTTNRKEKQP